ncbi:hypothetical protein [Microbacter margulisiae]|uniref:Uncharacterized protein n=1 Tax=Microbacter margulisiae TaxID=1350067 RepID=A0A7W5H0K3_9PORP|nr:hypothetical protein [Microbacter margulisiae]MBB3186648.1 hypothetical protein [Microbacter margulisiae]
MDSKIVKENTIIVAALFFFVVSTTIYGSRNNTTNKSINHASLIKKGRCVNVPDSFVYSNSNEDVIYKGMRVYPSKTDSNSYVRSLKNGVFLSLQSHDTLYVLVDEQYVCANNGNAFSPAISEITLKHVYPKYFHISHEDDLPYFIYLKNHSDSIVINNNKRKNKYTLEYAFIRDTLFRFQSIQVGQNKKTFFHSLGLATQNLYDIHYVVLANMSDITAWYTKYMNTKTAKRVHCHDIIYTILVRFKNDKVYYLQLGSWIEMFDK